ncbi:uncharacterized protein CIMG_13398 [Coccidioides immitis RS]|uniref:Uncharacterized protein n=1 Tax=Coccidioides immitis (strain RS) TaxID=246410 RepID=A0A0D8JXP8_COCIM|nr:uncharacterized protein CIMG_13398 [Coccidioides immitis RS]KJF61058.1 hypothetical protein CIMG_13398 [Coccidioides immitis RS]
MHLVAHTAQRATPSIKSTKIPVRFANKKTRDTERVLAHKDHCRPPYPHPIFVSQGSHISTNPDHLTLSGGDNTMSTQASPLALKPSSGSEWTTTQANHFWATLKLLVALNLAHAPCIDDGRVNTVILSHHSER